MVQLFNMETVKMSKKGQIVVPKSIREALGLSPEDRFVAYGKDDYVVFKKIDFPEFRREFKDIVRATAKISNEKDITEADIEKEITAYRKKIDEGRL